MAFQRSQQKNRHTIAVLTFHKMAGIKKQIFRKTPQGINNEKKAMKFC